MRLDPLRLGLAVGVVWAFGVVFLAAWVVVLGLGKPAMDLVGSLYIGYAPTLLGADIGGVWGFIDGFIGGLLVGWVYNWLSPKQA